jgi:hypothetical protein
MLLKDCDKAVINLFKEFLYFLINNYEYFKDIFVHNLGNFDGYFLYPVLSRILKPNEITTTIDNQNRFILIEITKNNKTII